MTESTTATATRICNARIITAKGNERFCKKELDANGKHADGKSDHSSALRKTYLKPSEIPWDDFSVVTDADQAAELAPTRTPGVKKAERSAELIKLDGQNKKLYAAWVKAGRPDHFTRPVGKLHVPPEAVETVKFLVRSSVEFLGYGATFGDDGVRDSEGRTVVSWQVRDKRERKTNGS